jgi:hypothetical protein
MSRTMTVEPLSPSFDPTLAPMPLEPPVTMTTSFFQFQVESFAKLVSAIFEKTNHSNVSISQ